VARKEHNEFASNMDMIDVLPPGLYEAVLQESKGVAREELAGGDWLAGFEARDMRDLAAHGGTSPEDEKRFAAARRVSEANLALYRMLAQPALRAVATPPVADTLAQLHPARLSYTLFSDRNPWMAWVSMMAGMVRDQRQPVQPGNPGRVAEKAVSDAIERSLTAYGQQRDAATERLFQVIYDAPVTQALTGVVADGVAPRPRPGETLDHRQFVALAIERLRARMAEGGLHEALLRALVWVRLSGGRADERSFATIRRLREAHGPKTLPLQEFKRIIREQFFMLLVDEPQALATLPHLLPADPAKRAEAFGLIRAVVEATGDILEPEAERLAAVERIFLGEPDPAATDSKVRRLRPSGSATA
jgi:hypothetical protein